MKKWERCNIYSIKFLEQAIFDIQNIAYYISYKLCNSQASNRFVNNIFSKVTILEYFPYIGIQDENPENRFIIYKNFLIFYEIQEKESIIIIKTIIHTKTNKDIN